MKITAKLYDVITIMVQNTILIVLTFSESGRFIFLKFDDETIYSLHRN